MSDTLTLDCIIKEVCGQYFHKTALMFEGGTISYAALYDMAKALSCGLTACGLKKGDKVGILLPNCPEYIYSYFALFLNGCWAVPLNPRWEKEELKNVLADSDVTALIFQDQIGIFNYTEILPTLADQLPQLKSLIILSDDPLKKEGFTDFHTLLKTEKKESGNVRIDPDDVALLAYTSGTTGIPKGVMITHKNLVLTSKHTASLWDSANETTFSVAPLYAAQGFLALLVDLVSGLTMKWISTFNPHDILKELAQDTITSFHTQPTMWTLLLSQDYFQYLTFDHIDKVVVSGSLCSAELAQRIETGMGCTVLNGYGLIEATGVVTVTRPDDPENVRFQTVGKPIPGVSVKIVDEHRKELPSGKVGELAVKGYLMKGYYKQPEKTAEAIDRDGWLYTGDLAEFHDDGETVRIVGRLKDMIIRGGFNVYPIDIESCLLKKEDIEDVSVVGKPHAMMGESIVAYVIPKPGTHMTAGDVIRYCRGRVANYKVPDEVIFVSQFPIILSGKIQKNRLKEWAETGVPDEWAVLFDDDMIFEDNV